MKQWYLDVITNKYVDFTGRARRKEYWIFYLCNLIIVYALVGLSTLLGDSSLAIIFTGISSLYSLAILLPALAVLVRRLHDIDKSWTWIFISLIPIVGIIWFIVLLATDSQANENQYGPCPK